MLLSPSFFAPHHRHSFPTRRSSDLHPSADPVTTDVTTRDLWPALPLEEWRDTYATLHMWTQMVGKTCLALAPPQNHWWHIALRVTARGLATGPMPYGTRPLDAEFDFIEHELVLRTGEGAGHQIA